MVALLSIPNISNVKAQSATQTEYDTHYLLDSVFIRIHFSAGQPYNFPYNGWVFIDGALKGHTLYGFWCGIVSIGDHTVSVNRRGYSNSATITVDHAFQYFYIQFF